MMGCEDLVLKFETSQFRNIVGVKAVAKKFEYAVTNTTPSAFFLVRSAKALKMWPNDLIDFLEKRIVFEMPKENAAALPEIQLSQNINVVGLPDEIIGNLT